MLDNQPMRLVLNLRRTATTAALNDLSFHPFIRLCAAQQNIAAIKSRIKRHKSELVTGPLGTLCILISSLSSTLTPTFVHGNPGELRIPTICSAATAGRGPDKGICTAKAIGGGHQEIKVNLTATTTAVHVAGYNVVTDNYSSTYLTPIVEVNPGDTIAAHLVNILLPRKHDGAEHGDADQNPTNLHLFHGGIVSPNNARPKSAELGTGDNIYVHLKAGNNPLGRDNSFDLEVPIPGEEALDARVLEGEGFISHPLGLNWYHSHMHGISSDQVMGGMSGLISVGEASANVKAACQINPAHNSKCLNDVTQDTLTLRRITKVEYVLLRDLPLKNISARPEAAENATADWDPSSRDLPAGTPCGAWKPDGSGLDNDDPKLRLGYCQRDPTSAWLFTLNGQRYPDITIDGGQNVLLRIGNLSPNVAYWLELYNATDGSVLPLTILSLDGVVPAKPVPPQQADKPIQAFSVNNLLMMPAMRAEVYLRNDLTPHAQTQIYGNCSPPRVIGLAGWRRGWRMGV
jgi:hypothetical protein